MRQTLLLLLLLPASFALSAQAEGDWFAILDAMGTKLPMQLDLRNDEGTWSGRMIDPTKAGRSFPLTTVSFDGQRLQYAIEPLGASFSGVIDGKELRGVFNQAQVDFPLTFSRHRPDGYPITEGPVTIRQREQDPTDFPYLREAVRFPGGAEGVTLAGELTLPQSGTPKALLVLISGSGPQDRNAYLGSQINHSPFLVLSDFLTRRGYGVLRYDERGIAESTGDFSQATTADLAKDAAAAVAYLRSRPGFKEISLGMVGHSEGGMIAPIVARDGVLDFAILLAAPAIPIDSLMLLQRRLTIQAMGMPEAVARRDEPALRAGYAFVKESTKLDQDQYVEGLYEVFIDQIKNLPEPLQKSIVDKRAYAAQYVNALTPPWYRYFFAMDPTENLEKLTIPVLAINGTKDVQVPAEINLNAISKAMAINGNKDATVLPLLELNHLFQPADTGSHTEYGTIETTFDPTALEVIGSWLDERY